MKNLSLLSAPVAILAFAAMLTASPATAASPQVILEQRLKTSFNTMVQDVHHTEDPSAKREIISRFLTRLDKGLALVQTMSSDDAKVSAQAAQARAKIQADLAELNGMNATAPAAAGNFNAFASFVQQDVEQADGVYLSVGALIIILLILIILL